MRKYGKIETGYWQNPKVRKMGDAARTMLLYLLTCPHGNSAGCFILPLAYMSHDLTWDMDRVTQTVSELLQNGFIRVDDNTNMILITGWWGHNVIENRNVAKNVCAAIQALPNCQLKQEVIDNLLSLPHLHETVTQTVSELLDKPFRNPEPSQSLAEPEPKPEPSSRAREGSPFQKIYEAGIAVFPNLAPLNTSSIQAWISAGCNAELDAIPEIERHAKAGKSPRSWGYFTGAIMDAFATRTTAPPPGTARKREETTDEKTARLIQEYERLSNEPAAH